MPVYNNILIFVYSKHMNMFHAIHLLIGLLHTFKHKINDHLFHEIYN